MGFEILQNEFIVISYFNIFSILGSGINQIIATTAYMICEIWGIFNPKNNAIIYKNNEIFSFLAEPIACLSFDVSSWFLMICCCNAMYDMNVINNIIPYNIVGHASK